MLPIGLDDVGRILLVASEFGRNRTGRGRGGIELTKRLEKVDPAISVIVRCRAEELPLIACIAS